MKNIHGTRAALMEANYQRWWCPSYTIGSGYDPGQGIPTTGHIIKCGMFRCDTLVGYSYAAGGFPQIINRRILFPKIEVNHETTMESLKLAPLYSRL